jgi:heme-degrading monooxygenase HmoA
MFALIFRAKIKQLDDDYTIATHQIRELAMDNYGCTEFTSLIKNGEEICISYWPSMVHIESWKRHAENMHAIITGKNKWYEKYSAEVVEIKQMFNYPEKGQQKIRSRRA